VALAVGRYHGCAVTSSGAVWCWGSGTRGSLGNGSLGDGANMQSIWPIMAGLAGATAIAAGDEHNCAVVGSGSVRCWGGNGHGQLGVGTISATDVNSIPLPVIGL
jgi:alpha-tubulin suppressor-like RCC1 family protein